MLGRELLCQHSPQRREVAARGAFLSSGQDLKSSSFLPLFLQGSWLAQDELLAPAAQPV